MNIIYRRLDNCEGLHESNGNWRNFLSNQHWVDTYSGYTWFNNSNMHWIVYPGGTIHELYGCKAHAAWMAITGKDHDTVYNKLWDNKKTNCVSF